MASPKIEPRPKKRERGKRARRTRRIKSEGPPHLPSPPPCPSTPASLPVAPWTSPRMAKYWRQRYSLFSRYDEGIAMDEEGWFSVTPEPVAAQQAGRTGGGKLVVDCFSGVGGNAIQFAQRSCHVVAIDIDPKKVTFARNNAEIYGVEDNIDFVIGDFFRLAPSLKSDVLFLSPPWGGPAYSSIENFTLEMLKPKDGYTIFQFAQKVTPNIIMFLPRNVDANQVEALSWLSSPPLEFKIEENYIHGHLKGITAYFGNLASGQHRT